MSTLKTQPKPIVLVILDGWGYSEEKQYNAIAAAHKPHWDTLWSHYPHMLLNGSGLAVGLPEGQMGNSEVGHINLGSGRIVYQDSVRIDQAIADGSWSDNTTFNHCFEKVKAHQSTLHVLGLLSPGGVHSHEQHIQALLQLAAQKKVGQVVVHPILDGRDTPPQSAEASLRALVDVCQSLGNVSIGSLIGRYYAMDRDRRWERIQKAYDLYTQGIAEHTAADPLSALTWAYQQKQSDEFVVPIAIEAPRGFSHCVRDKDAIIFMNFRADRARELSFAFTEDQFDGFKRAVYPKLCDFVTLTQYHKNLKAHIAFAPQHLKDTLAEILSAHHYTQFRIAETEKYAHVTFFFNGGIEEPYSGETRKLIASPKVATYDLQPEMHAVQVTDALVEAIQSQQYDFILCNYANADMVGHSGDIKATIKAIEALDEAIGRITAAIKNVGGELLITADHGNAECLFDEVTQQPHTAHTTLPVPLIYVGQRGKFLYREGILADIAPTILRLFGLAIPKAMTGKVLLELDPAK